MHTTINKHIFLKNIAFFFGFVLFCFLFCVVRTQRVLASLLQKWRLRAEELPFDDLVQNSEYLSLERLPRMALIKITPHRRFTFARDQKIKSLMSG